MAASILRPALALVLAGIALCAHAAPVTKSENDPRSYRALVLDNGLRAVVVSDPQADMGAASLSVDVGSGADPRDREGLAHFLEHMLFLGTERYPQPGEYKDFISRHGGSDNAYTAFDETNYFFEVEAGHLEPALDRFSQFFVAPLFNPEYVDREREVVNSEYLGRRDDDGRRIHSAVQAAVNPQHPYSTFAVGNLETLADRDSGSVRDELLAFYHRYYSANRMTLAVVGREPLDTLERWVRDRFSAVENRGARALDIDVPLFRRGDLPATLDVVPLRERYGLSLTFPIPPTREHWRSKPVAHIAHLLGHEGPGSLLAELKRRGWAQALSAGTGFDDPSGATLSLNIQLTPAGAAHGDEIVALAFAYLDLVRADGVERWVFDENARLAEISFRFSETPSAVALARRLASMQHEVPQREVLRAPFAYDDFRPDLVREYLSYLRPDNVLVARVAPDLDTDRSTRWYDTRYRLARADAQRLAGWQARDATAQLALPPPNPFLPARLALLPAVETPRPEEIASAEGFRLWFQQDTEFGLPKADFFFSLRSPIANDTPRHSVLTQLYVDLVNDQLDDFAYAASLAGLDFRLYTHARGLSVRISGFDDRQQTLLERILAALAQPRIDPDRFAIVKSEFERRLENSRQNQPYSRAMIRLRDLLLDPNWTVAEQLSAVRVVSARQLERFVPELLANVQVVALAHGNLDAARAASLGESVRHALVEPASAVDVPRARVARLRRGDRLEVQMRAGHPESALVLYLQGPDKTVASRARSALVAQILSSPFFDQLRTEKKLGYVVFANDYSILDSAGLVFIVQSPIAGPRRLEDEVRDFFDAYRARLRELDAAEFEQHKRALVARVLETERQLGERSERYWREIDRENLAFDTREQLAAAIRTITPAELAAFYDDVIDSQARRQLAVRVAGSATPEGGGGPLPRVTPAWLRENRALLPP